MAYHTNDSILKNAAKDKHRARASATFEVLPQLMGFDETVILRAVDVDYSRNIVSFYFSGEGLDKVVEDENRMKWLVAVEGQECIEVIPPAWEVQMKKELKNG